MDKDNSSSNNKRQRTSFYANKTILAPMVRVGALPMRLLALRFGADLVYTEEIIDFKLLGARRFVNEELGTVDYIDASGAVFFRTCEEEKDRVVLQIGTNSPERAVRAAKIVEEDVAAIDINMGCPKSFSLKGGMGAALLSKPELIQQILCSLKAALRKPVSCKIRILPDLNATVELAKLIEQTGVDALGVHGRTKEERPQHPNRTDYIRAVVDAVDSIPVIANGGSSEIDCFDDIAKFKAATGASSVMIARAAQNNCSIFAKGSNGGGKKEDLDSVIKQYLRLAIDFDNNAINTKYCLTRMLGSLQVSELGRAVLDSFTLESFAVAFNLQDYYTEAMAKRKAKKASAVNEPELSNNNTKENNTTSTASSSTAENIITLPVSFDQNLFVSTSSPLPKTILNEHFNKSGKKTSSPLTFRTVQVAKQFHSVVSHGGKHYSTPYLEKTKRLAEQAAALVLLLSLGLFSDTKIINRCLVTTQNVVHALQHVENGQTYYIKVNK